MPTDHHLRPLPLDYGDRLEHLRAVAEDGGHTDIAHALALALQIVCQRSVPPAIAQYVDGAILPVGDHGPGRRSTPGFDQQGETYARVDALSTQV